MHKQRALLQKSSSSTVHKMSCQAHTHGQNRKFAHSPKIRIDSVGRKVNYKPNENALISTVSQFTYIACSSESTPATVMHANAMCQSPILELCCFIMTEYCPSFMWKKQKEEENSTNTDWISGELSCLCFAMFSIALIYSKLYSRTGSLLIAPSLPSKWNKLDAPSFLFSKTCDITSVISIKPGQKWWIKHMWMTMTTASYRAV